MQRLSHQCHQGQKNLGHSKTEWEVGIDGGHIEGPGQGQQFRQSDKIVSKVEETLGNACQADKIPFKERRQPEKGG